MIVRLQFKPARQIVGIAEMAGLFGKIECGQHAGERRVRSFCIWNCGQQTLCLVEIAKGDVALRQAGQRSEIFRLALQHR